MKDRKTEKEWFENWFDTSYYHILYGKRNEKEANSFIKHLTDYLKMPSGTTLLDLACGKGRHSLAFQKQGFLVMGVDLSPNNIKIAKKIAKNSIEFRIHDMRIPIDDQRFDIIVNLFTSFGYFENLEEDEKVIQSVVKMLQPKGIFVIDFMNVSKIRKDLPKKEVQRQLGIDFTLHKYEFEEYFIKDIIFESEGKNYFFQEKVRTHTPEYIIKLAKKEGLTLKESFGGYDLKKYEIDSSLRWIGIFEKF